MVTLTLKTDVTRSILGQDSITLQDLIMTWHGSDGMVVALTRDTPLVCLQIDRWATLGEFRNRIPIELVLPRTVDLPVFTSCSTQVHWQTFYVMSTIAHWGRDQAGHCRASMHSLPQDQWYISQDGESATLHNRLNHAFRARITVIWLAATTAIHPNHMPSRASVEYSASDAMIAMIRQMNT